MADSNQSSGSKEPYIRRVLDPQREGAILRGCPAHSKALAVAPAVYGIIQSSMTVYSERDHQILHDGMTCDAAFRQNALLHSLKMRCPASKLSPTRRNVFEGIYVVIRIQQ